MIAKLQQYKVQERTLRYLMLFIYHTDYSWNCIAVTSFLTSHNGLKLYHKVKKTRVRFFGEIILEDVYCKGQV